MANSYTQAEKSYEAIKNKLLARVIEEGARLSEAQWAQQLGVNRGDIRSALARLYSDGLVTKGSKGGFFARKYTDSDLESLYEARAALESAAVKLAVQRVTKQDIAELQAICDQMQNMAEHGYILGCAEADVRFHTALVRASHNSKLVEIYNLARIPLRPLPVFNFDNEVEAKRQALGIAQEHAAILNLLKKKHLDGIIKIIENAARTNPSQF